MYYLEIADEGYVGWDINVDDTRLLPHPPCWYRIALKTVSLLDIKLPMMPAFLLNMMSKQGPFDFIVSVKKHWKHFDGSPWETRLTSNAELYDDVRERVTAYMGMNGGLTKVTLKVDAVKRERPKTLRKRISTMFRKKTEPVKLDTGPKKFGFEIGSQAEDVEILDDDDDDSEDEDDTNVVPPVQQMIQAGGEIIKRVSEASEGLVRAIFETASDVQETANTIKQDGR